MCLKLGVVMFVVFLAGLLAGFYRDVSGLNFQVTIAWTYSYLYWRITLMRYVGTSSIFRTCRQLTCFPYQCSRVFGSSLCLQRSGVAGFRFWSIGLRV